MKLRFFAAFLLCGSVVTAHASSYSEVNSGIAAYVRGDLAATIQHMTAALADQNLDPNFRVVAYFDRGVSQEDQQKADAAIADFSAAIAINPKFYEAYSDRGDLYSRQRKYPLALADFSRVIEGKPSWMDGYIDRAGVYQDQGNLDAAIADLTYGLSKNPDSAKAYQLRGRAYQLQKQFSKAMADFDKVVALYPKESGGYLDRGVTYEFTGDHKAAQKQLNESLDLNPTAYDAYYYLGLTQWGLGQYAEARKSFALYIDKTSRPIVDVAIFEWAAAAWSGESGDARLKLFRDRYSGWPTQIFDFLLGTGTEDAMRAAAKEGDAVEVSRRLCGVDFAIGLSRKTHGAKQEARQDFSDTQSVCPPLFGEAAMSASELNRAP
jgi:tetratricopeptide (TPR) repeat protein